MKKSFQALLSIFLLFGIVLTSTSCRKKTNTASSDISSEVTNVSEQISGDSAGQTTSNNSTAESTNQSTVSNTVAGDGTWKQVLENMPKELKNTTIEVYNWNPASETPGAEKVISNFQKATKIKVKWTIGSYENYDVEIAARVAAGNSPDMVRLRWINIPLLESCQPITNSGFNFNDAAWDKDLMDYYTIKGKPYAANLKNTLLNMPRILFYNKEVIEKYDLEDPYLLWKKGEWTESKLLQICRSFKDRTGTPPYVLSLMYNEGFLQNTGFDGAMSFNNGKFSNALNDPKVVSRLEFAAEIHTEGITEFSWDMNGFVTGKRLFFTENSYYSRMTQPYFSELKSTGGLGVVPLPSVDGQSDYYQPFAEYEAYGIAKGAKNAKAVPYFLRYYLDAANYNEDTYFCSTEALEVYKFCMSQKNRMVPTYRALGGTDGVSSPIQNIIGKLNGLPRDQIKTTIEKGISSVDKTINDLNNRLSKFS